jgi:hypothetical protein
LTREQMTGTRKRLPVTPEGLASTWKRLAWFVTLWAGGVVTVGLAAELLKLALNAALRR